MKILIINVVCGIRSTGRICTDLAETLEQQGHDVKIAYGREIVPDKYQKYAIKIGSKFDQRLHGIRTRVLDEHGFGSRRATKKFLQWADEFDPDLVWIHNIHGYYINIEILFEWIKKRPDMQVKWTLHDCWAFTGHCSYFTAARCERWKEHCNNCVQKKGYPTSLIKDNSSNNFERKKAAFTGVRNMTLITPSQWLADLVKQSFLAEYPVEVCYNTIDTNVFKPTPSDFRKRYGLENKKIILGVASVWEERKGLDDFIELSQMLDDSYVIVLVGLSEKQIRQVQEQVIRVRQGDIFVECFDTNDVGEKSVRNSNGVAVTAGVKNIYREIVGEEPHNSGTANVVCLPKTNSAHELAAIYTAADFFVNPTYEDNFPTVNLEAIACGTYVITYLTGGSPETLLIQ